MKCTFDKLSQSKRKPERHYKMPRLDLKSEVKMQNIFDKPHKNDKIIIR